MTETGIPLAAALALAALSGFLRGRHPGLSLGVAACGPLCAFAVPNHVPFGQGLVAVFSLLALFKWVQWTREKRSHPPAFVAWHFVSIFDARSARRRPPGVDWGIARTVVGYGLAFGLAYSSLQGHGPGPKLSSLTVWGWFWGVVAVVGLVGGITEAVRLGHGLVGWDVPVMLDRVWAHRGVRDFWGQRWNRTVSGWLRECIFRPWVRRGRPGVGLWAAFGASAALHAYLVVFPLGPAACLPMGAFFLVQAPLCWLERRLPKGHRMFGWAALLGTSPLFIHPFLRILLGTSGEP